MMQNVVLLLLEAALRALAAACVLGLGLRLLRVRNVPAQKAAWGVVLMAALAMPLLMRLPWLPAWAEVKLPVPAWPGGLSAVPVSTAVPAAVNTAPVRVAASARIDASPQLASIEAGRFPAPVISVGQFDAPPDSTSDDASDYAPIKTSAHISPSATSAARPRDSRPPSAGNAEPASARSKSRASVGLFAIAWLVYLGVAAVLLCRLFFGLGSSLRVWNEAKPVDIAPDCDSALPAGAIPVRAVPVRWSRHVSSPVNIGSGILLPADYSRWGEEKLRVVLAHERSHVRQWDFYLQLLAGLYAASIWFSPLGWWLKRKLSELGEAISDRAGLEASASPSAYAQLLLEFAARPRPTFTGVTMAHSSRLSQRIERLLNDETFRQAFAGRRRMVLAVAIAPVALIAATALVRVQAAEAAARPAAVMQAAALQSPNQTPGQARDQASAQTSTQAAGQTATTGQSHPDDAQVANQAASQAAPAAPQPNPAPAPLPAPPALDGTQTPAPSPAPNPEAAPMAPVPPTAPGPARVEPAAPFPPIPPIHVHVNIPPIPPMDALTAVYVGDDLHKFRYEYDGGDPYAIVGDPETHVRYSGDWDDDHKAEIDKARGMAHGHFLWFRHDDKSYIVDDPAVVAQIEAMEKPMDDLRDQMKQLGKQMRDAGQQAREAARKARETSKDIPTPDLTKEMADLNAAVTTLQAQQGGTISREQLQEIQRKLGEVQRKLINVQIKVDVRWSQDMGEFGKQQGELGAKMGELGSQMGSLARENNQKIRSIIDESLKDGKARPVN